MRPDYGPGPGSILQLLLGFGIGSGAPGGGVIGSNPGKLDFSLPANSELIALLRRF